MNRSSGSLQGGVPLARHCLEIPQYVCLSVTAIWLVGFEPTKNKRNGPPYSHLYGHSGRYRADIRRFHPTRMTTGLERHSMDESNVLASCHSCLYERLAMSS